MHENVDHLVTLHEIVEEARRRLPEGVWDYLVGGAESETTLRRNRQALDSIAFRPRVLCDVSGVDCSSTLLGRTLRAPLLLAPIGSLQDLHPRGGAAVAEAATAEDAALACDIGIDAVYVSNHGARQLDHGRGSIDVLPEVVEAVAGRAEILVDGGFLRGTDIVKAIALGATAVGIGRLNGFGIAAGGAPGITRMLEMLEGEIRTCLGLLGVNRLDELDARYLHRTEPVHGGGMRSAYPLLDEDPWAKG